MPQFSVVYDKTSFLKQALKQPLFNLLKIGLGAGGLWVEFVTKETKENMKQKITVEIFVETTQSTEQTKKFIEDVLLSYEGTEYKTFVLTVDVKENHLNFLISRLIKKTGKK